MGAPRTEVVVRPATPEDAEAVADIGRVAWPATYATLVPEAIIRDVVEQTYNTEALERAIAANDRSVGAHFLVAELDGQVIGFLDYSEVPEPELHRIYVDPAATGGGIGSRLLEALHERLARGSSYVLMVAADNSGAVRFYERHGFVREAEVDGVAYYREHMGVDFPPDTVGVTCLVLRRTI